MTTNRLALNVDKSHFVLFHSSSNIPHRKIRIKIKNKRITEENDVKFLGVLRDSTLSWKPHTTELSKKLSKTIGIFYKLQHYTTADVLKLLYYALLYPFLIYGSSVWGMAYQSHSDKLRAFQNKFKAISFSDKYDSPYPLFHTHGILKISGIIKLQIASFVIESRMRLSPLESHTYFTSISDVHSYGTRQSTFEGLFQPGRRTTQYGINTVHYFGVVIADCSWGCLMGLWWLMPDGIGVWAESTGSVVDRL